MIFEKMQLVDEIEGDGNEIELLVDTRWPAQEHRAHEALSPCHIIPPKHGIRSDVIAETLAGRRAQPYNLGFGGLRAKFGP